MNKESYTYHLRLLKLPCNASEQDIQSAINKELRLWTRRVNAPNLEARQEAERKVQTLETAMNVLLGPEGQIIRNQLGSQTGELAQIEISVEAEAVARAIESVTSVQGTKTQERKGRVLFRRSKIFYRGINYLCEELVHKKYESAQDRKRCFATDEELVLFDWFREVGSNNDGQGKTITYIQGPWVVDLIAFAPEYDAGVNKR